MDADGKREALGSGLWALGEGTMKKKAGRDWARGAIKREMGYQKPWVGHGRGERVAIITG